VVDLTIDGRAVSVPDGATLLDACRELGIEVPTLCWAPNLEPATACRVCVVEVQGSRVLVPSCGRVAEPGMVVLTDSPRVRTSRKLVLELLGSSVDLSAADDLRPWMERLGAEPGRFGEGARTRAAEPPTCDNDLYTRDYAKCVMCFKCVDACGIQAQASFAIAVAGRGVRRDDRDGAEGAAAGLGLRVLRQLRGGLPDRGAGPEHGARAPAGGGVAAGGADGDGHDLPVLRRGLHADAARAGRPRGEGHLPGGPVGDTRHVVHQGPVRDGLRPVLSGVRGEETSAGV
jgi:succinate dehydrogenase/fumarate reductase-like Fe-S protein